MDLVDHIFSPIESLQRTIERMDETISSRRESTEAFCPASHLSSSLIKIERCVRICRVETTLSDRLIFASSSPSAADRIEKEEDGMCFLLPLCKDCSSRRWFLFLPRVDR